MPPNTFISGRGLYSPDDGMDPKTRKEQKPRWNNAEILAAMESLDRLFQRLEAANENK